MREIAVFGGTAHPALAAEICTHLTVQQRPVTLKRFANDCLEVQLQPNCRERDVFLIRELRRIGLDGSPRGAFKSVARAWNLGPFGY